MNLDAAIKILEHEFSDHADEITNVDLLGGEPLSNYNIIPELCNWIWERNSKMQVFIRTNGTLLSSEMKNWFSGHCEQVGLGLSIDGTPKVNYFNRGVTEIDIDFFKKYWPDIPVKITVFPQSVEVLYDSVIYLYGKGVNIIGGLAQGVIWDEDSCAILNQQMDKLVDFYLSNPQYSPISPLFALNFEHSFEFPDSTYHEKPCWEKDIVHTYDCEDEMLPCHMFSTIVQGKEKRESILKEAATIKEEIIDNECKSCPIRWSCVNCMALNYQHFGKFSINANKHYSCSAHKITAYWSATLLTSRALNNQVDLSHSENVEAIQKAIDYLKIFNSG